MTNWQTKKLGDLTQKIGSGVTPRGGSDVFVDDGVFFIRSQNIRNNKVDMTDRKYIPKSIDEKMRSSRVQKNDILYNITGASIGRSAIYKSSLEANVNQHVCIVRIKEGSPKFVQYALSSEVGARNLWGFQAGGNREGLNFQQLASFKIKIPEKPEQERIVGVLEVWDEYIEKLEQKIALKEQLKKGLMQQLLTGKHRLPSFSEKWIVRKMGEFAKESRVKESDNDVHKRLTVRLHLKGVEARGVRGTEAVDSTQYYRRSAGQLIYGKQNIFKGSIGVVPALYDGYASSQDIPSFDIEEAVANVYYIYYYLSRKSIYEWLENFAGGSGSKRLHTSEFYNIKIQLPSLEEQNAIVEVLQLALKEIETLKKHRDVLTRQKKYLLKNLITGTIRTPEDLQPLNASRLERSAL